MENIMLSFEEYEYVAQQNSHTWRYIRYRAASDKVSLEEAARSSLGHMHQVANDLRKSIAIITAFRHENVDKGVNTALNQQLLFDIRKLGYGSIPVAGGFVEDILDDFGKPTGEKKKVEEGSFLINAGEIDPIKFHRDILSLVQKYNQDAALVRYVGEDVAKLIKKDGSEEIVGKWHSGQLSAYYTRMVKGPTNRQFTFEAAGDLSVMTQMAIHIFEKKN
jgi:hypothetical protein